MFEERFVLSYRFTITTVHDKTVLWTFHPSRFPQKWSNNHRGFLPELLGPPVAIRLPLDVRRRYVSLKSIRLRILYSRDVCCTSVVFDAWNIVTRETCIIVSVYDQREPGNWNRRGIRTQVIISVSNNVLISKNKIIKSWRYAINNPYNLCTSRGPTCVPTVRLFTSYVVLIVFKIAECSLRKH